MEARLVIAAFVKKLEEASEKLGDMLCKTKLEEIEGFIPSKISEGASLKEGAKLISNNDGGCLVCERGIITLWDLAIKQWTLKKLTIAR